MSIRSEAGMTNKVSTMGGCRARGTQPGVRVLGCRAARLLAEPIYPSPRGCHQFPISWRLGGQLRAPDSTILMKAPALLETVLNKDGSLIRLSR